MSFSEVYAIVDPYTGLRRARLMTLWKLIENLNAKGIPGDIVECGVRNGGSAAVLAFRAGPDRKVWLYDSFEGLPNTTPKDGERAKQEVGKAVGCISKVQEVMGKVKVSNYIIKPGWFKDTFKNTLPDQVALLHCDADFYESTLLALRTFYPLIPKRGYVVLDDFGCWEGERIAFYEFCAETGEMPLVERIEEAQLWWCKGKEHNRSADGTMYSNGWAML